MGPCHDEFMPATETIVRCNACSGLNAHGLRYCLFCGADLEIDCQVTLSTPRPCKFCNKIDSLSQKYCVSCGANMSTGIKPDKAASETGSQDKSSKKTRTGSKKARAQVNWQTIAASFLIPSTVLAAIYGLCQYQMKQNTGLIIHASPVGSSVTITDGSGYIVQTGTINKNGELKILGFKPGKYNVAVTHVGYTSQAENLNIVTNKLAALGIPQEIELKPELSPESEKKQINKLSDAASPTAVTQANREEQSYQQPHLSRIPELQTVMPEEGPSVSSFSPPLLSREGDGRAAAAYFAETMKKQFRMRMRRAEANTQAAEANLNPETETGYPGSNVESPSMRGSARFPAPIERFGRQRRPPLPLKARYERPDPSEAPAPPFAPSR